MESKNIKRMEILGYIFPVPFLIVGILFAMKVVDADFFDNALFVILIIMAGIAVFLSSKLTPEEKEIYKNNPNKSTKKKIIEGIYLFVSIIVLIMLLVFRRM